MSRWLGAFFIVMAGALLLSSAAAQETQKGKVDVEAFFKKLDINSDGKLQKDEFLRLADHFKDKAKAREKLSTAFTMIDAEKRGFLSKDQFRTYLDAAKKKTPNQ
jgi:Ca2+-binding EF-hand superfamily protein